MTQPGSRAEIEDAAARWVARIDGAGWTAEREAELEAWLALDQRHRGAMLRAEAAWAALDRVGDGAASAPAPLTRRRMLVGAGGAVAASVGAGWLLLESGTRYATETGEIRRVPLDDGSIATINTESRVRVQLSEARRDVRVDAGEAWFQVSKDPGRPFVVAAGRVRVRAVGTAFAVRRRDGGADVLVTEGIVEAWADGAEGHRVRLAAGAGAFIGDNAAIRVKPVQPSAVDRALAWRGGKIDLAGATLAEAAREFDRYNRRKIAIATPALGREQFDGTFRMDDPEGFARAVASSLDVAIDLSDPQLIRIGGTGEKKARVDAKEIRSRRLSQP